MTRPRLRAAVSFLTRLPVGRADFDAADIGRSTVYFPLVGALLGAGAAGTLTLAGLVWGPVVAAGVAVAFVVLATGALHQDALADTVDGLGGARDRERALAIMRDSRIGAYGTLALLIAVGLRWGALAEWASRPDVWAWLVSAGALSRWASLLVGWRLPYARPQGAGLGRAVSDEVGPVEVAGATVLTLVIVAVALGRSALGPVLLALVLAAGMARWMMRRIGGATGDTLGAVTEVVEVGVLLLGLVGAG